MKIMMMYLAGLSDLSKPEPVLNYFVSDAQSKVEKDARGKLKKSQIIIPHKFPASSG